MSTNQAKAILDLKLNRLTGLEQDNIYNEYTELLEDIKRFSKILSDPDTLWNVIKNELIESKEKYGDERKTEVVEFYSDLTDEDLIPEEDLIVTLSREGYAKTQQLDVYQAQNRGGTGKRATSLRKKILSLSFLLQILTIRYFVFPAMEKFIGLKFIDFQKVDETLKVDP